MCVYESWLLDYYCLYMLIRLVKIVVITVVIYVKDVIVRLALSNVHLKMLEDNLF